MDKKNTIVYFICGAAPLAIHFLLESVSSFLRNFNVEVHFLTTMMVLSAVMCILNTVLCWLAYEKVPGLKKLFLIISVALSLIAGFIGMMFTVSEPHVHTENFTAIDYVMQMMPIVCATAHGALFYMLYGKLQDKPILPFISLIAFFALYLIGLPFALLGYYVHFIFAGVIPFVLAIGAVVVAIRTWYVINFPPAEGSSGGGNKPKPKRYTHLTPPSGSGSENNGPSMYEIASNIASEAKYNFASGLSNVYPGSVDHSVSGDTVYLTFHYSCKRSAYIYTPSDSDIMSNAVKCARNANSYGVDVEVDICCDQVYTD